MKVLSAVFECSAPDVESCPDESLPEFAFIGRSNVGKSSLLNMLAGQDGLARVSPRPGFTKLINFFIVNKRWRLVDLPGYGFAEGARKDSARFNIAVGNYLTQRPNLSLAFALIESSLAPQALDLEFVEWLARNGVPFVLVFTKVDKGSPAQARANMAAFMERIAGWFEKPPKALACSAETRQGRQELLGVIDEVLDAIEGETGGDSTNSPEAPAGKPRALGGRPPKRRPDLNRPW